jgi:hypothetical protein
MSKKKKIPQPFLCLAKIKGTNYKVKVLEIQDDRSLITHMKKGITLWIKSTDLILEEWK